MWVKGLDDPYEDPESLAASVRSHDSQGFMTLCAWYVLNILHILDMVPRIISADRVSFHLAIH